MSAGAYYALLFSASVFDVVFVCSLVRVGACRNLAQDCLASRYLCSIASVLKLALSVMG